jgi:hypothetical protein
MSEPTKVAVPEWVETAKQQVVDKWADAPKGPNRIWLENLAIQTFDLSEGNFGTRDWHDADGIEWFAMGQNATHWFYLGVNAEDRLYRKSVSENGEHVSGPITQDSVSAGYLGHW